MPQRDGMHGIKVLLSLAPVVESGNTALVSAIVDTRGYDSCTFYIGAGVLADAAATFTALLEDGDDSGLSDNAGVADIDLLPSGTGQEAAASFTEADDGLIKRIGYIGSKRYVRLTVTPANNASSAPFAVMCVLGHPWSQPT
jgi:hypothetical protein